MATPTVLKPRPECAACYRKGWYRGADRWPMECHSCRGAQTEAEKLAKLAQLKQARDAKRRPQAEG